MLYHWRKYLSRSGVYLLPVLVNDCHKRAAWQAPISGLTVLYSHGSVGSRGVSGARLCSPGWFGLAAYVCHLSQNQWASLRMFSWLLAKTQEVKPNHPNAFQPSPSITSSYIPVILKNNNKKPHGWTHSQGLGKTVYIFNNSHTLWKMLTTHIGLTHMC